MKKAIVLLFTVLASLFLIGCSATSDPTKESAPVGATVRLLGSDGSYIDMSVAVTDPLAIDLQVPAGTECEVLSGPKSISGVTLWEIDCSWDEEMFAEGWGLFGWVDVTNFQVLD